MILRTDQQDAADVNAVGASNDNNYNFKYDDDEQQQRAMREKMNSWPIHAKKHPRPIDQLALEALPGSAATLQAWREARRWLDDDTIYEQYQVPVHDARNAPAAPYKKEFIDKLVDASVICRVKPHQVRGHVKMFAVPEPKKERFRSIKHTVDINDFCGRESLSPCVFPTKIDIAKAVHAGGYFIALDFSAYYDQFELSEQVGRRMCFSWNKRLFRLRTLPMGQRQAVGVANAATQRLLDFPKCSRHHMSIIDNVIFIGDRDAVIEDAWTFIQRCKAVFAVLNEIDVQSACRDDVAKLVTQSGDWGGIHIDLVDKTVALTDKCIEKTRVSWNRRAKWQWRDYAAHMGLLFWAWGIIAMPMADFYDVLRFNSVVGSVIMHRYQRMKEERGLAPEDMPPNPVWYEPAIINSDVMSVLTRWTEIVLANAPRKVLADAEPEVLVECDASRWGWCCFGLNVATNEAFSYSEKWSDDMERDFGSRLGRSTFAEPQGVARSLIKAHERFPHATNFAITNDNTAAVFSYRRGFNHRVQTINECLREVEARFPKSHFKINIKHVAGVENIADGGSRGQLVNGTKPVSGEQKQLLRSRWGHG